MATGEGIIGEDKSGVPFEIVPCQDGDLSCLMDMYESFSPRPASQGLPPEDPDTCRNWVKGLLDIGRNVLARRGREVIGHVALIPDLKGGSGEFVIFVHQKYRNQGIGTVLTRFILERAKDLGFQSVWLTVANSNFVAIKLYRKIGFQFCEMDACERTMIIEV